MQLRLPFRRVSEPPPAGLDIEGRFYPLTFVRHRRARHYILRTDGRGGLRVTIPRGGTQADALAFVRSRHAWIVRESQRRERDTPPPLPASVEKALRKRADGELRARLAELAVLHGLTVARVSVRSQRSRWGSCSPSGTISLNWRLVELPPWVRDYVLLHELAHLKHLNHSPRFWKEVARMCPDHAEARAWLRTHHLLRAGSADPVG